LLTLVYELYFLVNYNAIFLKAYYSPVFYNDIVFISKKDIMNMSVCKDDLECILLNKIKLNYKTKPMDDNSKRTEMLELSDKSFKASMLKMLNEHLRTCLYKIKCIIPNKRSINKDKIENLKWTF
jgi:hypothetical protein